MANAQGTEVLSPIGKLVQGSTFELQNKLDDAGKPIIGDDGKPVMTSYFAVAVDKNNPEWPAFWTKLVQVAQQGYPQYFQNGNVPGLRDFAWKITDGDGFDKYGKPNKDKPGFAGCWVIKLSSTFLPRCFEKNKYAKHEQLQDSRAIKPGYFVRVAAIVRPNTGSKTHGIYVNADLVSLEYVGEEIVFGRDANAAFGQVPASTYVPQGAMQLGMQAQGVPGMQPNAGASMGMQQPQGMPGMQQPAGASMGMQQPMGGMPQPQQPMGMQPGNFAAGVGNAAMIPGAMAGGNMQQPHGMPGTNVQPNAGFVQGAMQAAGIQPQQPAQGMPGAPMGMPQPQAAQNLFPTPKAAGYTYQQFIENGFKPEQLIAEGYFVYG